MATSLTIDRLTKVFSTGAARAVAVDNISFGVEPGELFFLLGPSGCGKTTLLRMIAGFVEPTGGRVLFDGRDVTGVPANRRNTGMVFQSYALWPHMTVEANVSFGLDVRRLSARERAGRVAEALGAVRLGEYGGRRPHQLSGGQQQRVALARALVVRPDVLLLDEPLSNLDARLRTELRAEIRRICKGFGGQGITTIYVTHDQKEAMSMADRVAVIDRGRVVQVGAPPALYRRPATRFVAEFLGETNILEGRVVERSGDRVILDTSLGRLVAHGVASGGTALPPVYSPGERVLCSMRPEAFRLAAVPGEDTASLPGENRISGRIAGMTYLGETAQILVEVAGVRLKTTILNPPAPRADRQDEGVILGISPLDIALLPLS